MRRKLRLSRHQKLIEERLAEEDRGLSRPRDQEGLITVDLPNAITILITMRPADLHSRTAEVAHRLENTRLITRLMDQEAVLLRDSLIRLSQMHAMKTRCGHRPLDLIETVLEAAFQTLQDLNEDIKTRALDD